MPTSVKRRWPQRPPRSLPQQSEKTLDLVVDLWSVADDQRGGHGPRDDRANGTRVAHPLSAIGAALTAFLNRLAYRFAISLAGLVPGPGPGTETGTRLVLTAIGCLGSWGCTEGPPTL